MHLCVSATISHPADTRRFLRRRGRQMLRLICTVRSPLFHSHVSVRICMLVSSIHFRQYRERCKCTVTMHRAYRSKILYLDTLGDCHSIGINPPHCSIIFHSCYRRRIYLVRSPQCGLLYIKAAARPWNWTWYSSLQSFQFWHDDRYR